jgi:hypothetical protein
MKSNNGIIALLKELLKFFLRKIVGTNNFYKIVYYFKYRRISKKELKNIK